MLQMALVSPTAAEFDVLLGRLRERVEESQGETIYIIGTGGRKTPGLNEDDLSASIATLQSMTDSVNAECVELRQRQEKAGLVAEFLVRKRADEKDFMEVRYVFKLLCDELRG